MRTQRRIDVDLQMSVNLAITNTQSPAGVSAVSEFHASTHALRASYRPQSVFQSILCNRLLMHIRVASTSPSSVASIFRPTPPRPPPVPGIQATTGSPEEGPLKSLTIGPPQLEFSTLGQRDESSFNEFHADTCSWGRTAARV
jgi:hypothetical protein